MALEAPGTGWRTIDCMWQMTCMDVACIEREFGTWKEIPRIVAHRCMDCNHCLCVLARRGDIPLVRSQNMENACVRRQSARSVAQLMPVAAEGGQGTSSIRSRANLNAAACEGCQEEVHQDSWENVAGRPNLSADLESEICRPAAADDHTGLRRRSGAA
jgi:hypothetical protein